MEENEITGMLIGIFLEVHKELGPGLLESIYEEAICIELEERGISFVRQQGIVANYKNRKMGLGFRADIIVLGKVIVEIKSIEQVPPVHYKTLLSYLRMTKLKVGLLVNFNVLLIKDGIRRVVNGVSDLPKL